MTKWQNEIYKWQSDERCSKVYFCHFANFPNACWRTQTLEIMVISFRSFVQYRLRYCRGVKVIDMQKECFQLISLESGPNGQTLSDRFLKGVQGLKGAMTICQTVVLSKDILSNSILFNISFIKMYFVWKCLIKNIIVSKILVRDKHTSLFFRYNNFLLFGKVSWSVCPWKQFPA
jgi:hypothetical protein